MAYNLVVAAKVLNGWQNLQHNKYVEDIGGVLKFKNKHILLKQYT